MIPSLKMRAAWTVTLALIALLWSPQDATARQLPGTLDTALKAQIDAAVTDLDLKGVALSVRIEGYPVVSFGAGISRPGVDIDPDKVFLYASFTKLLTSIIMMQLVEAGEIALDDSIGTYVDPIPNVDGQLTLRSLAGMRATVGEFAAEALRATESNPDGIYSARQALINYLQPPTNPNFDYYYSDANFLLLGFMIERVTGNNGRQEFNNRLFVPANTTRAALAPTTLTQSDRNGAWFGSSGGSLVDVSGISPNGYLTTLMYTAGSVGTTADMLSVLRELFHGTYLSTPYVDEMTTPAFTGQSYGLGVMRRIIDGGVLYGHGGGGPLNNTRTFYEPARGIGLSVAVNHSTDQIEGLFQALYRTIRSQTVGVNTESEMDLPAEPMLQAWPSPATGAVTIAIDVDRAQTAALEVFDLLGRKVDIIPIHHVSPGGHRLSWDPSGLSAGVYMLRLQTGHSSETTSVVIR